MLSATSWVDIGSPLPEGDVSRSLAAISFLLLALRSPGAVAISDPLLRVRRSRLWSSARSNEEGRTPSVV